jgi:pimeloyl-ACP methyl ester carboxylesterase
MKLLLIAVALASTLAQTSGGKVESEIQVAGPSGPLKGAMIAASPSAPVVLIIPGSGPTDRDGNNPLGVKASTYRLLAEALAERGVSSVRIDKRGMFASAAAAANGNDVTIEDYAADVRAWTGAIRQRTGAKCVWIAGHSEGGLVALAAAQKEKDVCGLLLISAPGRPLADVMREQLKANPANASLLEDALSAISRIEAGQSVDVAAFHPALQGLFAPQVQKFLTSLFSYDPAALIRNQARPVLILQGESDIQVSSEDAKRLATANPRAKLVLLPGVNHVLKSAPAEDRAENIATYANPDLPLAPGVAAALADFVLQRR